ncbi:MAG TPA: PIN domain-containing protein [Planctomycetota bacterium]|nr:PIN domain-containing protein [Planctomycetota bacterium]
MRGARRPRDAALADPPRLCRAAGARGNLVPDAYFAALAIESGCEWVTTDRDYSRFLGFRWCHPSE